jgi:hypothetical protein
MFVDDPSNIEPKVLADSCLNIFASRDVVDNYPPHSLSLYNIIIISIEC